jgi:hypothetical protein
MMNFITLIHLIFASFITVGVTASSYADGGKDIACWKAKIMVPCSTNFPGVDISVDWSKLEGKLIADSDVTVPSKLILPASINVTTPLFKAHNLEVDHTNIHACLTKGGFCSPFVAQSPGLVTHTEALKGGKDDDVNFAVKLEEGTWTFITHYRIFVDDNIRVDFAKGRVATVEPLRVETTSSNIVNIISIALSIIGILISLVILIASFYWRRTNVFKLASWKFCVISSFGACLGNVCILLWVPPLTTISCMLRPFLIPIAFDFLFFPLLLKTWRLKILLVDNKNAIKRINLPDSMLFKWLAVPVCIDVIIAIVWIIVSAPEPTIINSVISASHYEIYCASSFSLPFMSIAIVSKVPLLIWGLKLSWATRTIISELNESSHILLSMINMFFVICYVLVIQFLISDSQSALVMLRVLGTFIAATFTLLIVLGPKIARLLIHGDVQSLRSSINDKRKSSNSTVGHSQTSASTYASNHESSTIDGNQGEEPITKKTSEV